MWLLRRLRGELCQVNLLVPLAWRGHRPVRSSDLARGGVAAADSRELSHLAGPASPAARPAGGATASASCAGAGADARLAACCRHLPRSLPDVRRRALEMVMTEELEKAQGLLASGDIPGLLLHLRADGETLPLGEVARLVAGPRGSPDSMTWRRPPRRWPTAGTAPAPRTCWRCTTSATRAWSAGSLPGRPAAGPRAGAGAGRRAGAQRAGGGPGRRWAACARRRGARGARAGDGVAAPFPVRLQRADGRQPGRRRRRASGGCPNRRMPRGSRRARKCGACSPAPRLLAP